MEVTGVEEGDDEAEISESSHGAEDLDGTNNVSGRNKRKNVDQGAESRKNNRQFSDRMDKFETEVINMLGKMESEVTQLRTTLLLSELVGKTNQESSPSKRKLKTCPSKRRVDTGPSKRKKDTAQSTKKAEKKKDLNTDDRIVNLPGHSLIAMSVKVLPTTSVVSLNPICCLPFRGDFDGDCFHGYVPQSIQAKVELDELVALDKQLVNRQNGRNLLSLGQDSLTAAYLVNVETNCFLNRAQMQQLQMYCPFELPPPAIIKASSSEPQWTGMQIFGMLLPPGFEYTCPLNDVVVSSGELLSSSDGSAWLRDGEGNFIQGLLKEHKEKVLDIMYSTQEMFSQELQMRGLSVSLTDLYLASDPESRRNLTEEISYGLQEAEQVCNKQQLMVESRRDFLAGNVEDLSADFDRFCYERQRSATLSKLAVSAFKDAYRDVQSLAYRYGDHSNSFLIMSKAGSKGNIGKLAQHNSVATTSTSTFPLNSRLPSTSNSEAED
ncbi:hypothetical protein DY000_02031750 [Brassica cretica]|uniref:DNA-directed RNA polymerase n=1 Tax=Brassica cretica TaxID=69181 RepID=A0ABQ7DHC0_BRACR|nr:hypothetical protein DY000_02031750 [Brassica cretica]